ncbi:DNA repair protein RecO [Desulfoscipio geothermicus]|uniref:DNA repair protein RecO n=1 Tax=Desulfoscipio geothermicus DSM 3669 TaxID=1121426 RepID=A0A1I6D3T6_9FIRM|nr:DNA repair protein RecO [Desulfoscipio geothermicus]SFR00129.1 DNA replication and repair protein RecO [Desulfoscipio geothermicus DSM 3669]
MKLYKVRAVVLNSRAMCDADRVLTLYAQENGKIRAVAHGAAKPTSRKRGAVQPFSYTYFLLRRGRELDSVSQCEGLEIFPGIWSDLDRMTYAGHVTELVDGLTAEGEPNGDIFKLLLHTLRLLENTVDVELTLRYFELRLVALLGYLPYLEGCANCGGEAFDPRARFSAAAGGLVCPQCSRGAGEIPCTKETVAVMKMLLHWDAGKINRIRVSQSSRAEMRCIMREYLQWHMEKRSRSLYFMERLHAYRPNGV